MNRKELTRRQFLLLPKKALVWILETVGKKEPDRYDGVLEVLPASSKAKNYQRSESVQFGLEKNMNVQPADCIGIWEQTSGTPLVRVYDIKTGLLSGDLVKVQWEHGRIDEFVLSDHFSGLFRDQLGRESEWRERKMAKERFPEYVGKNIIRADDTATEALMYLAQIEDEEFSKFL